MNAVVKGVTLAAAELGWEVVGIRNGFAGLLEPDDYPDDGLLNLSPQLAESLDPAASSVLGQSPRVDPFHMRQLDEDGMVEEVDRSDELLAALQAQGIGALVSVVGGRGLSILYKLHRKGLNTVCIPRSLENDIAATMVTLGFNRFHHRDAGPCARGGKVFATDRCSRGAGRTGRLVGLAGRHCRGR
jgi:6-phosphofructokinase 1